MAATREEEGVIPFPTFPAGYKPKCSVHAAVARAMGAKWPGGFAAKFREMVDDHVANTQRVRDAIAQHGLSEEEARAVAYYCADARILAGATREMSVFRELNSTLATRRFDKAAAWHDFTVVLDSGLRKLPPFAGDVFRGLDRPLTRLSTQYQAGNKVCWVAFTSCSKRKDCLKAFAETVGDQQGAATAAAAAVSKGTWIALKVSSARDISALSMFSEDEVLLLPNTFVRVEEVVSSEIKAMIDGFPANLDLIRVIEIESRDSSPPPPPPPTDSEKMRNLLTALCSGDPGRCFETLNSIRDLSFNNEKLQTLVIQAVHTIVATLQQNSGSVSVCEMACAVLSNIAVTGESRARIAQEGAIPLIFQQLAKHQADAAFCTHACNALLCLATDNDFNQEQVGKGSSTIVGTLIRHQSDATVCVSALGALRVLSELASNQAALCKEGGIEAIVVALRKHGTISKVAFHACRTLWNISSSAESRIQVEQNGGIEAILVALEEHLERAANCVQACGALRQLSTDNETNQKKIVDKGGVLSIFKALKRHDHDDGVKAQGCAALRVLARHYDKLILQTLLNDLTLAQFRSHILS